jgi:ethanolamine transporter EutH
MAIWFILLFCIIIHNGMESIKKKVIMSFFLFVNLAVVFTDMYLKCSVITCM